MSKKKPAAIPENGTVLFIPLNKLKKSPRNARKTPHTQADIEALAASIAANGMLQNPVVEPEIDAKGKPTGFYLVTAGEGRRLAQLLRAKRKQITKTEPVRCLIDTEHNAFEISLAENAVRSDMHPADQFEAFFALHAEHGMNAEDIAARFGVTPAVVRLRLKLAAVSPKLIQVYRDGDMNLDQLTAFAIVDDHAKQEAVWEALPGHSNDRDDILAALTEEQVRADDRRALFVGAKAYRAAGGAITRDLFVMEDAGYFADAALLNRLAQGKLQAVADTVKAEGWKWIEVMSSLDHGFAADMRRIYPKPAALSDEDQAKLDALEAQFNELSEDDTDEAQAECEKLEAEIAALTGPEQYRPEEIAIGGAIVSLSHDGEPRIERGFIRAEDDIREPAAKQKRTAQDGKAPLSDKLVAELTAHQTVALRDALAQQPDAALNAVVHALAGATFFPHGDRASCLHLSTHSAFLSGHAPGIAETQAAVRIGARHEAWAQRLPEQADELWAFVCALAEAEKLALMAHCASLSIDAVQVPHSRERVPEAHVAQLTEATGLDMAANWKPTVASYFSRVSKDRILEAVSEAVSAAAADNIKSLKKGAMAEAAETRMADSQWLPPLLRTPSRDRTFAMAAE